MRIKIKDTEIKITVLFMGLLLLLLLFDKSGYILPCVFAATIHEIGHLIPMLILHSAPKEINLIPGSVQIVRKIEAKPKNEIMISLSGPILSLLSFLICYVIFIFSKNEVFLTFAVVNLLYGVFNLLPLKKLDGGEILRLILETKLQSNRVNIIMNILSLVLSVLTLFAAVTLCFKGNCNFSLFILGIYFLLSVLVKL